MSENIFPTNRIDAFIFDLDGTLVETEFLKARSYSKVIARLTGKTTPDQRALNLYEQMVGSTDEMICNEMIKQLGLEERLDCADGELWTALHQLRMEHYLSNDGTAEQLTRQAYQHNIELLKTQKSAGRAVAIATSSFTNEAKRVVAALGLRAIVDAVVGLDCVTKPKPNPDIYLHTMELLGINPDQSIIIEDSPIGTKAAIASGSAWICVATPFSRQAIKSATWLDRQWVVDDPINLTETVDRRLTSTGIK